MNKEPAKIARRAAVTAALLLAIAVSFVGDCAGASPERAIVNPECERVAGRDMESIELAATRVLAKEGKRGVLYYLCLEGSLVRLIYHDAKETNGYSTLHHVRCQGRPSWTCDSIGASRLLRLSGRDIEVSSRVDEKVARRVAETLLRIPEREQRRLPRCGGSDPDTFSGTDLREVEFIGLSDAEDRLGIRLRNFLIEVPLKAAEAGTVQVACFDLILH